MAQGTNSAALIRLQPLQNNDIGAIVEEHIRYYRNKKDSEEAQRKANEAQASKFKAARNKEAFDLYKGLTPDENKGFLNAQIVSTFEKNKPYYRELAEKYANGDLQAGMTLQEEKEKIANVVKLNKTYGEKSQSLSLQQSQGLGNEFLDKPILGLRDSFGKGNYKMNPDWSLSFYNPNTKEVDKMDSSSLFNNDYLSSSLNKKADFTGNGATIAKNLLDKNDGQSLKDENTRLDGVRLVQGLFAQDNVELRSFIENTRQNEVLDRNGNIVKFNDANGNPIPLGDLQENPLAMTKLASLYYDNFVDTNLIETTTDNRLEDALKLARLKKLREEEKEVSTDFTVATDEQENKLTNAESEDTVPSKDALVVNAPSGFKFGKGNAEIEGITFRRDNGQITAIGNKKTKVYETDEFGERKLVDETVEPVTITNRGQLNAIAKKMEQDGIIETGNLKGLFDKIQETEENFDDNKKTKSPKPVYKGLDDDGNPIFE